LQHVLDGESSVDELLRVVDVPLEDDVATPLAEPATTNGNGRHNRDTTQTRSTDRSSGASRRPDTTPSFELDLELLEPSPVDEPSGLLVDDEDQFRRVVTDLLSREGFEIIEARDGAEALEKVDRYAPDLIVLDLNLPGLDGYGYGVLTGLRTRPITAEIPVVILTALGDEDNEVRVFQAGADDFLAKPIRARALAARLRAIMRSRQKTLS
jgi:CheY-like chemotaxis protein